MSLYFAYGSNMHRAGMAARCPGARAVGLATLAGWRFAIGTHGYASIVPAAGDAVIGVLWRLTARDVAALNAYECLDSGLYLRRHLTVRPDGGARTALVYVGRASNEGRARPGYLELILAAARDWQMPERYIRSLRRYAPARLAGASESEPTDMNNSIRHIVVHGRVQGVGFRAFVEVEALRRGLEGWVRNRHDGSVEALFRGDETLIVDLIEACRRGPLGARVDALYQSDGDAADFRLRRAGEVFSLLPTA